MVQNSTEFARNLFSAKKLPTRFNFLVNLKLFDQFWLMTKAPSQLFAPEMRFSKFSVVFVFWNWLFNSDHVRLVCNIYCAHAYLCCCDSTVFCLRKLKSRRSIFLINCQSNLTINIARREKKRRNEY